ncbi:MAG: acyl-CoA thioesterase [Anaerolineae bacterium]|nr:acyl-CoA thioesterase [Anaerolineae bacterium]MDW8173988.1 thioesterase family protein [Anaerolineae bacterium]
MEGYPHQALIQIRYNDMDTLGHVNNAVYFTYFELARVRFFRDVGIWDGDRAAYGVIMAKATVEYKLPITLDDESVMIWTRCSRLGNKSFDLDQVLVRRDGAVATTALTVGVAYDYRINASVVLPDAWRARLVPQSR